MSDFKWNGRSKGDPENSGLYLVFFQKEQTTLRFVSGHYWLWGDGARMREESAADISHWSYLPNNPGEEPPESCITELRIKVESLDDFVPGLQYQDLIRILEVWCTDRGVELHSHMIPHAYHPKAAVSIEYIGELKEPKARGGFR